MEHGDSDTGIYSSGRNIYILDLEGRSEVITYIFEEVYSSPELLVDLYIIVYGWRLTDDLQPIYLLFSH